MNGGNFLADTNILLYLLGGDDTLAKILNGKQIYISFITELELLSFKKLSGKEKSNILSLLNDCIIIDINQAIKTFTIEIRENYTIKLPDAIIAATSKYLNLPLITSDNDFKKLKELTTVFYSSL